ncbi:hypothetical protein FAZ95_17990 [Trinickia violacea]|uniref:Lipoprotein n=1 Tax=Trinickia violacea TaxID=2571746 RepID=A0A4P8IU44_9BURK|nr:hypothetical protein [Trinickia violacea]QCP50873.1 hypothetical protein FAZ95_17990 [Trinickia violacea]
MTTDFRRTRVALLLTLTPLLLAVCKPALAQQNAAPNANTRNGNAAATRPDDDAVLGPTEQGHGAAMDADAARMRGAAREDDLLGAPAPYGDPYTSQFENGSNGAQQTDLMNAESVPMNGLANKGKQGAADPLPGKAAPKDAQAVTRTPANAAKSVYRGSADPLNPDKQQPIYRTPW